MEQALWCVVLINNFFFPTYCFFCADQRWRPGFGARTGWKMPGWICHHQVLQANQPEASLDYFGKNCTSAEAQLLQDRSSSHHTWVSLLNLEVQTGDFTCREKWQLSPNSLIGCNFWVTFLQYGLPHTAPVIFLTDFHLWWWISVRKSSKCNSFHQVCLFVIHWSSTLHFLCPNEKE